MAIDDIEPGTEVVAEKLQNNFSYFNSFTQTIDNNVRLLQGQFDSTAGHKHTGTSNDAPVLDHHNLSDLTVDDHPQYVLVDGSRAITEITVVGNIDAYTETLQPAASMGTTPILLVNSYTGTNAVSVVQDGTVNVSATGAFQINGVDVLDTIANVQYITLSFDTPSFSDTGRMKAFFLPLGFGGFIIQNIQAFAYQVSVGATPTIDHVDIAVFRDSDGTKGAGWDEVFTTLTLSAGSYVVDDWTPSSPEVVTEGQYIGAELTEISDSGAIDIAVVFTVTTLPV